MENNNIWGFDLNFAPNDDSIPNTMFSSNEYPNYQNFENPFFSSDPYQNYNLTSDPSFNPHFIYDGYEYGGDQAGPSQHEFTSQNEEIGHENENTQSNNAEHTEEFQTSHFEIGYDYSDHFDSSLTFASVDEMKEYLCKIASRFGFYLTTTRSKNVKGHFTGKSKIELMCTRSGDPKPKKPSSRDTSSGKCYCLFRIECFKVENFWKFYIVNGVHNHDMTVYPEAHPQARRLTNEEKGLFRTMVDGLANTGTILSAIKNKFLGNKSSRKDIYNLKAREKVKERVGRTQMQQLMHLIEKKEFISMYRTYPQTNQLEDLFFTHKDCVKLVRAFPYVLFMDCTYSTNRFNLPFFEIVGVTSTNCTFCVAFACLRDEKQPTYEWALGCLREILKDCRMPRVVLTDRDQALTNAVENIFPTANHLFCTFHIAQNVLTNCSKKVPKEVWDSMKKDWKNLMDCKNEYDYEAARMRLERDYRTFPDSLKYMCELLDNHREKFVACYTNKTRHLGNRTTNRVEGTHSSLKRYIKTSAGNLEHMFTYIKDLLSVQHNKIRGSLGASMSQVKRAHDIMLFSAIKGKCSAVAMDEMLYEIRELEWTAGDLTCTSCEITVVYNLPCRHVIRSYAEKGFPIPLGCIDPHWTKLRYDAATINEPEEDDIEQHITALRHKYNETHDKIMKANLKAQIEVLCDPSKTTVRETEVRPRKTTTAARGKRMAKYSTQRNPSAFEYTQAYQNDQIEKRRSYSGQRTRYDPSPSIPPRYSTNSVPRTFEYMQQIPQTYHDHIFVVNDVLGDGHCGFRVVAKSLGMDLGEDDWGQVRKDLQNEIKIFPLFYVDILGELKGYDFIHNSFIWDDIIHTPPPNKWMSFPETGYIIASRYNIAVVLMHSGQGLMTFLPMHSSPPAKPGMIVMAHVNENHYVEIIVDERKKNIRPFPMPPIIEGWAEHHSPEADQWKDVFRKKFNYYEALRRRARPADYSQPMDLTYDP